ncbi:MAG: ABC transporter permease [Clostridia bacterium]|nr:ABC transporter permease [Clostridia bacterium]
MEVQFESQSFLKKAKSMLKVDARRMFTTPLYYIMVGISLVVPILILVMTSMMSGTTIDPVTGEEVVMETFTNTWQAIGSVSGDSSAMGMSLTGMCNINMLYFFIAVLVCLFVSDDFRSGYAKNLFTVRAGKVDYVLSKSVVGFVGGCSMLLAYFVGAMIGGGVAGLSFNVGAAGAKGIIMCMIAKLFLVAVFVPIYIAVSVAAKQRAWLSILGSCCVGMLLFTMIPMMTPLDSTVMNVVLCLAGGAMFSVGLGAVSNLILKKTNIL